MTPDWAQKIRDTAKRLNETHPSAQVLVYASPKRIGAEADSLKQELRKLHHLHLEVRDKHYFSARDSNSHITETASEKLAADIVDPYLASKGVKGSSGSALTFSETRAAHLFLMLQLKDDTGEKGLTKLSFEAVVRSILSNTDANNRIGRLELLSLAKRLLPGLSEPRVEELTLAALARLVKRQVVRVYQKDDTVCLSFEEATRVREQLATCELDEVALDEQIGIAVRAELPEPAEAEGVATAATRARRILGRCLYARAETFASAVLAGRVSSFALDHLQELILQDLNAFPPKKGEHEGNPQILHGSISRVLNDTATPMYRYLKGLADAYTLMAFLRSTPDVQTAVHKIFSHGEIWLDTTIILPMLAEELLDENQGRIQRILAMTRQAGIDLYTTNGVLEELASHIHRAVTYTRLPSAIWEGGIPFIFEAYVRCGRDPNAFSPWVETLMGESRPVEDLSAFIEERFGVRTHDLTKEVGEAEPHLRNALDSIWLELHEKRRSRSAESEHGRELDPLTVLRLAKHDTESYLGVVQRRTTETASPLGFKSWWLTFDRSALKVGDALKEWGIQAPSSPVLSIDFLSQYLSLGPVRGRVAKHEIQELPLAIEPRLVAFLTPELLEQAKQIRLSLAGLPERVIARRVRDHLDAERRRMGPIADRGTNAVFDEISDTDLQS
ncbi:MAG: hypothetical protein WBQ03_00010 [Candidatus Sulfotelmatobacter sp.]